MLKRIGYFIYLYKRFGLSAVLFLAQSKLKSNRLRHIRLTGISSEITLSNFTTDVTTLFQIFFAREYEFPVIPPPTVIVDCGANIGLASVYFANRFPNATIIAIEPDDRNFEMLLKNTHGYSNVYCRKAAVWSENTRLKMIDPGLGNWGLQTIPGTNSDSPVQGITITSLMNEFQITRIDLLKIDIEGAEKEIFDSDYEAWLANTRVLAIELHDDGSNNINRIFKNAVDKYPHREIQKGENKVCYFS